MNPVAFAAAFVAYAVVGAAMWPVAIVWKVGRCIRQWVAGKPAQIGDQKESSVDAR